MSEQQHTHGDTHVDNRCCFCGAEDDHDCIMCPDFDVLVATGVSSPSTPEATPRPWIGDESGLITSQDGNLRFILRIERHAFHCHQETMDEEDRACMEFMLTAVNAHDALVAALKGLMWRFTVDDDDPLDASNTAPDIVAARAAIALVESPKENA